MIKSKFGQRLRSRTLTGAVSQPVLRDSIRSRTGNRSGVYRGIVGLMSFDDCFAALFLVEPWHKVFSKWRPTNTSGNARAAEPNFN